jgi:fumarylacetoacetate (FAA) hydrolase family protein
VPASTPELAKILPEDGYAGTLIGRVWNADAAGPSPVVVREDGVFDISTTFPTVQALCEQLDPARAARQADGVFVGNLGDLLANADPEVREPDRSWLLAPVDLQVLKAAGVTFAASMIERVIEERTRGDATAAAGIRQQIVGIVGDDLSRIVPGSERSKELKAFLIEGGLWSQYLEVGLGPDAEIFTKAPTLSAVGTHMPVGVLRSSTWNNPEPEIALAVSSAGVPVGAVLANDVNLRDVEGRSALLLPLAKDNNASCAIGPFLRLFDETYDLDDVRSARVELEIDGTDGFHLDGVSEMSSISRDPADLVTQLIGPRHQYPDGAVLLLGTMFAPTADRGGEGMGFTHRDGDVVRISSSGLGALTNTVSRSEDCEPWTFGVGALMKNLAERGLL